MQGIQQWPRGARILAAFAISFVGFNHFASADVIKFEEEELPRESVLPIFDNPEAVKNKYVPYTGRMEIGLAGEFTVNDAIYNTYAVVGDFLYHLNEIHGVGIKASYHFNQQTQYVPQICAQVAGACDPNTGIQFTQSSSPLYMAMAQYEFTPYYGKISFTKQAVMNLTFAVNAAAGLVSTTSSLGTDSGFGFAVGVNQKLFFTRNLGLKLDIEALFYNQFDVIAPTPQKKMFTNIMLGAGVVYLLPSL